jgi:hypothetical protein
MFSLSCFATASMFPLYRYNRFSRQPPLSRFQPAMRLSRSIVSITSPHVPAGVSHCAGTVVLTQENACRNGSHKKRTS